MTPNELRTALLYQHEPRIWIERYDLEPGWILVVAIGRDPHVLCYDRGEAGIPGQYRVFDSIDAIVALCEHELDLAPSALCFEWPR